MNASILHTPPTTGLAATFVQGYSPRALQVIRPDVARSPVTPEARTLMRSGLLPDLNGLCMQLQTIFQNSGPGTPSALLAIPALQLVELSDEDQIARLVGLDATSHVLVDNSLFKAVFIHWPAGKISSIHGHRAGGCVFKVLQGSVEELRYTTDPHTKLLATSTYQKGSMAYIDDQIGYHAVGNPFQMPAISLHVYTKDMTELKRA